MEAVETLLGFVALACLVLMIIGLVKPLRVLPNSIHPTRSKVVGIYLTGMMLVGLASRSGQKQRGTGEAEASIPADRVETVQPKAMKEGPKSEDKPDARSTSVSALKIVVESQIVKAVSGKYRYFFDIRNRSQEAYEGSVTITINGKSGPLGRETFSTRKPILPGLGVSVFLDINTGPPRVHGEFGAVDFSYEVQAGGKRIDSGSDAISSNLEDLP